MKTTAISLAAILAAQASAETATETVPSVPDSSRLLHLAEVLDSIHPAMETRQEDIAGTFHPAAEPFQGKVIVPTSDASQLGEPLRWKFFQTGRAWEPTELSPRSGPVAYLGLSVVPVPRSLANHLSLEPDTGLLIEAVEQDSPAANAGLRNGDVLVLLDEQILIQPLQFSVLVANKKEGDTVKLTYLRKGGREETSATLGKKEADIVTKGTTRRDISADIILSGDGHGPLRTFVRRLELPASEAEPTGEAPTHPDADIRKQLEEIRSMLKALQEKVK